MNKVKISNGLAATILVMSLFAGWQTILLVVVLMLVFCEINDKIKNLMVTVISFLGGIALLSLVWSLISGGVDLAFELIEGIVTIINSYLPFTKQIPMTTISLKFIGPVTKLVDMADSIVDYLILFTKFAFIISVLTNKAMKENPFTKKVNDYITKIGNFTNNFDNLNINNNQSINNNNFNNSNNFNKNSNFNNSNNNNFNSNNNQNNFEQAMNNSNNNQNNFEHSMNINQNNNNNNSNHDFQNW